MIPKIIHYCWFGGSPLPKEQCKYINGWKKILPDYQIIEWNEDNFDVNSNEWTKSAYNARKFAFVADYVRMYALNKFGGIYLDTDVQVLKSFDSFLHLHSFVSFEGDENLIGTAVIGAEKNTDFLKYMLDYYDSHVFSLDSNLGEVMNTSLLQKYFVSKGVELNNKRQSVKPDIEVFPLEYFSAKIVNRDEYHITSNTVCIHQYSMSWFKPSQRRWIKFTNKFVKPIKRLLGLLPAKYQ